MGILERIAGFLVGVIILITLALIGVVCFLPDAGRYLKIKNM